MFQYTFGLLPFRRPINIVVGKPIIVEKKAEPTQVKMATEIVFIACVPKLYFPVKYLTYYFTNPMTKVAD